VLGLVWLWLLRGGYLDGGPTEAACYQWAPGFENAEQVACPATGRPFGAPWVTLAP